MKINKFYLRKSIFMKKGEILKARVKKPVKEVAKEKFTVLPEYRSLLGVKRYKPTLNGGIVEDVKKSIKQT